MIPTTTDLTAAVKKTLTSAAFTKFMEHAVHSAVANMNAQPDVVVLQSAATPHLRFSEGNDYRSYSCRSADYTSEFNLQMERTPDDSRYRNIWYGSERRTDKDGNTWSRQIGHMVQDDFGFLVKVAA